MALKQKLKSVLDAIPRSILASMAEGVILHSSDGMIIDCNRAAERILGLTRDQMLGRDTFDAEGKSTREDGTPFPSMEHPAMVSLQTGIPCRNVIMGLHLPDDSEKWISMNAEPVFENNGSRPFLVITSFTDITERRRTELLLRESEEQLRFALDASNQALFDWNIETSAVKVNDQWFRLFGYVPGEIEPHISLWEKALYPDDSEETLLKLNAYLKGETQEYRSEHRIVTRNGEVRWQLSLAKIVARDSGGRPLRMIGTDTDITDKKLAERALEELKNRLQLIIDSVPIGISVKDREGRFVSVNKEICHLLGHEESELLGKSNADFLPQDLAVTSEMTERSILETGRRPPFQVKEIALPSGDTKWLRLDRVPLRDSDGEITGTIGTAFDITDQIKQEEIRKSLENQLWQAKKGESLARMAGAIAHNFNNRLQSVIIGLDLALHTESIPSDLHEILSLAKEEALRASETSRQMVTYLGFKRLSVETREVSACCRQIMDLLIIDLPPTIKASFDLSQCDSCIMISRDDLQQIIHAIFSNARESIGNNGGLISFIAKSVSADEIVAATRYPIDWTPKAATYACIEIRDTGCGITASELEKIFDPFYTTKFEGRGMGLALALGIIKAHEGVCTVTSTVGAGSTFSVFLPESGKWNKS